MASAPVSGLVTSTSRAIASTGRFSPTFFGLRCSRIRRGEACLALSPQALPPLKQGDACVAPTEAGSAGLQHRPQAADVRRILDLEDCFDEPSGYFAPEHRRDEIAGLVDHFHTRHRVARRAPHGSDTFREAGSVLKLDLHDGDADRQELGELP